MNYIHYTQCYVYYTCVVCNDFLALLRLLKSVSLSQANNVCECEYCWLRWLPLLLLCGDMMGIRECQRWR